ncbi:MAG: hypothetical protein ACU837_14025 [Gammaproteobacteria bacterium]
MQTITPFPDGDQLQRALNRTRDALGLSVDAPLGSDEFSVFIKYLLLTGLESAEIRYRRARRQIDAGWVRSLETLLGEVLTYANAARELESAPDVDWTSLRRFLSAASLYRRRLIDLALEAVISEPLAPELCVKFASSSAQEISAALPGHWNHAVIFTAPLCFTHELYPLAVDAYAHDTERFGHPRTNVVAAHSDWLNGDGQLKRILFPDFDSERFVETDLDTPLRPDSVQFLCLGRDERQKHAALSQQFACRQFNPASAAEAADDKAAVLAAWAAMGLNVPAWRRIAPGDLATALQFLERFAEIVVKPGCGTEGKQVAFFRRADAQAEAALQEHLQHCWAQGDAIALQRRDGICFRDPLSGSKQTLALRLNIAYDGERYCLESAYAQVGRDEQSPAACGRGGGIVSVNAALSCLVYRQAHGAPALLFDSEDWRRIRAHAECAAGLFKGLMLMGLDVILDHDSDAKIVPVLLEANPRPAGLSHSRLCAGDPFAQAPVGVSLKLWQGVSAWLS